MRHIHFIDDMEAGRASAMRDRNRGYAVGKAAKGWDRKAGDYAELDEAEQFEAESRGRFEAAISQFLEDVTYDVRGDEWEGF